VVVAVRGLGQVFNQPTTPRERAVERVLSGFYRVAFRLADLAWFTNPGDMKFFLDRGACPPQKTYLTNNAVDPTLFDRQLVSDETIAELRQEFGLEPGDLCVLMIARLIWRKGVREFVETAELLKERMPNVKFLLIAPVEEGSPDAVPEDFVRAAEKSGNFRWLGFRRDIRELSALCDLAVLPSWYKEGGYPRALLEPMALGKPVIGADTPDCKGPVRVGENGYLVPPQDSAALAAAVEKVLSDPALMAEFGRASRSLIETEFNDNLVWPAVFRKAGIPLASSV
jgi:N,N'-diacetylbacillosaminyl-diphospho-undecaprenol alpha-1,3-N-acetylgalactosaminyltransferase